MATCRGREAATAAEDAPAIPTSGGDRVTAHPTVRGLPGRGRFMRDGPDAGRASAGPPGTGLHEEVEDGPAHVQLVDLHREHGRGDRRVYRHQPGGDVGF